MSIVNLDANRTKTTAYSKDKRIKVLIIDDSAVTRQILEKKLNEYSQVEVVSTAVNIKAAEFKIAKKHPDAIILDLVMPGTSGLSYLRSVKKEFSAPIIIFSAYAKPGSETSIRALEFGAAAVVGKPSEGENITGKIEELVRVIEKVTRSKRPRTVDTRRTPPDRRFTNCNIIKRSKPETTLRARTAFRLLRDNRIIAIGASTGGTEAILQILQRLPKDSPPVLLVIHMPVGFTRRYAERLDRLCLISVSEAEDGDPLHTGLALVAPGDKHLTLTKADVGYRIRLLDGPPVKRHKPSVEVLFNSVAKIVKNDSLGIILTGMGTDGAEGLRYMHELGAYTIAQNEESCVVFGMPGEAIKKGGVDCVLGLDEISERCIKWIDGAI